MKFLDSIRTSITKKLMLSYVAVVLIPICFGGIYIVDRMQKATQREFLAIVQSHLKQMDSSITEKINSSIKIGNTIKSDKKLVGLVTSSSLKDMYIVNAIMDDIIPKLETIKYQNEYIYTIRVLHGNHIIPTVYDFLYYDEKVLNEGWKNKLITLDPDNYNKYGRFFVETTHDQNIYFPSIQERNAEKKRVFAIYMPIYSKYFDRMVAVIEIEILEDVLLSILKQERFQGYGFASLFTKNGNLLYTNNHNINALPVEHQKHLIKLEYIELNNMKYQISKIYIQSIDCWLLYYIPENVLTLSTKYKTIISVVLLSSIVTLVLISYILSKLILGKLLKLTNGINKIKQGSFDTRIRITSTDEIGELANSFNEMMDRIKDLMDKVDTLNKAEKEAIYRSLENQIKPHFVCNALDTIRMIAVIENSRKVADSIKRIMNYFMYNLAKKSECVSIKDELKNATDYIDIYNLIRNGNINYSVDVCKEIDGRLQTFKILKFILQPIVENSILHGFKDNQKNFYIFINISYNEEVIIVTVTDNGVGIQEEKVEEINKYLKFNISSRNPENAKGGIGLSNINNRLKLKYGNRYGVEVESYFNVGTQVALKVPPIDSIIREV